MFIIRNTNKMIGKNPRIVSDMLKNRKEKKR